MDNIGIFRATRSRPENSGEPRAIVDVAPEARPRAIPAGAGVPTQLVNAARNGRTGAVVPTGRARVRWSQELGADFAPDYLLAAGRRVVASGALTWAMFDDNGKSIAVGPRGVGPLWLASDLELLFLADTEGELEAKHLDAGQGVFSAGLFMSGDFLRPALLRAGDRMAVLGVERQRHVAADSGDEPAPTHTAKLSALEIWGIGTKGDLPSGELAGGVNEALLWDTVRSMAAASGEGIVVVQPGHLWRIDWNAEVHALFRADFTPVALSLDEDGWAYLIVDEERGRSLWVVRPDGGRTLRFVLPRPLQLATLPPVVSHDHQVSVIAGGAILTLDGRGEVAWARRTATQLTGALLGGDDHLLVADGAELVAFDPGGQRAVLHRLDGDTFVTAPVHNGPDGEIFVASRTRLHSVQPSRY